MGHQLPPQCIEEEERLLEILEHNPTLLNLIIYDLSPEDFYREANREKFKELICKDEVTEVKYLSKKINKASLKRMAIQDSMERIMEFYK